MNKLEPWQSIGRVCAKFICSINSLLKFGEGLEMKSIPVEFAQCTALRKYSPLEPFHICAVVTRNWTGLHRDFISRMNVYKMVHNIEVSVK